ncbi:Fic family protein [bacterium]|nr:Fic family protein [bacterium]
MQNFDAKLAGYANLIQRFGLSTFPHYCRSYIARRGQHKFLPDAHQICRIFPKQYDPGDGVGDQLEFALKHEGMNLEILGALFSKIDPQELLQFIRSSPKRSYPRRIWFLYEMLTGNKLEIDDLKESVHYADLIDMNQYFTAEKRPSKRHKVHDNLLGNRFFCPMIRRTERLVAFIDEKLDERCRDVLRHYPEDILRRALDYLYTKETKSSFAIEHIVPDRNRTARFISLLKKAGAEKYLNKDALVSLQQATVDERFANSDWRSDQNYVGMTAGYGNEEIHYISPKPEDVPSLMEGFLDSAYRMLESGIHPVLIAAAISFGFVFVHPFDDGNGRLHRFLIHHVLAKTGFTPAGVIFPVSATMLRQRAKYDALLETYSKPLLPLVQYELNEQGEMRVLNDTSPHYRYIDMTHIVEGLFDFIQETIATELPSEMQYLVSYDRAKRSIQEIVDMPDRLIDLFIKICHQNNGRVSKAKRESQFATLTDKEIAQMESRFQEAFGIETK